jgi:hypothetical protein
MFRPASGARSARTRRSGCAISVACHTPDALSRAIDNARDAGADEFFLVPTTAEPEELNRIREALGI